MQDRAAQHLLDQRQAVRQREASRQPQKQPVIEIARALAQVFGARHQNAVEHQREGLAEQFGYGPQREGRQARRAVVAGDHAPQPFMPDNRDRERGAHPHVVHIGQVHRRMGAQHAHRQIERRFLGPERRDDRHCGRIDIGDHAEPVAAEQFAGLLRDVGRRIAQAEIGLHALGQFLGHHLAAFIGMEAVDHHPVIAEHLAHQPRRGGA